MILPTSYPEICSNTILQSLASGTPIITTGNLGSADEWVVHEFNGWLTKFQVHDYMIHTLEMVRGATRILDNEKLHRKMIKRCLRTRHIYSWQEIGEKWDKMFRKVL